MRHSAPVAAEPAAQAVPQDTDGSSRADRPRPQPPGFRADIQGLRALAVGLVVLYHLWPGTLTGGFVGVDVFLVVSGFLITSHLVERQPRTLTDLGRFWAARVRRLLPAALVVIAVTLVVSRLVGPEVQWRTTATEALASALYVQNWWLASSSVDYLANEGLPSPFQHFWSLSVEEQFYLFWPILILILAAIARRRGRPMLPAIGTGLTLVVIASLGYSIFATLTAPGQAYFITPTRVWELGLGGLLAVVVMIMKQRPRAFAGGVSDRTRVILAGIGYLAIVLSAVTYGASTPFPGWHALLPVLGTVTVIAAQAPPVKPSPTWFLQHRPAQWIGDVSYSIYLWHWPLIVLLPAVFGGLTIPAKLAVLAATALLAGATKRFVEDPVRSGRAWHGTARTYLAATVVMALVVAGALVQLQEVDQRQAAAQASVKELPMDDDCVGASALTSARDCEPTEYESVVPAPPYAPDDRSVAYADDCWVYPPFTERRSCTYGDPDSDVSVAVLGNSFAGQWLPSLQQVAERNGWQITTFLASRCTPSTQPDEWESETDAEGCTQWAEDTRAEVLEGDFDLVVTSNRNGDPNADTEYPEEWEAGYRSYLKPFDDAGKDVLVIGNNPIPGDPIPECLDENRSDLTACDGKSEDWVKPDPMVAAATGLGGRIETLELTDFFCRNGVCPAVIGGVVVYFDSSHVTATYAKSMAPALERPLVRAVERR